MPRAGAGRQARRRRARRSAVRRVSPSTPHAVVAAATVRELPRRRSDAARGTRAPGLSPRARSSARGRCGLRELSRRADATAARRRPRADDRHVRAAVPRAASLRQDRGRVLRQLPAEQPCSRPTSTRAPRVIRRMTTRRGRAPVVIGEDVEHGDGDCLGFIRALPYAAARREGRERARRVMRAASAPTETVTACHTPRASKPHLVASDWRGVMPTADARRRRPVAPGLRRLPCAWSCAGARDRDLRALPRRQGGRTTTGTGHSDCAECHAERTRPKATPPSCSSCHTREASGAPAGHAACTESSPHAPRASKPACATLSRRARAAGAARGQRSTATARVAIARHEAKAHDDRATCSCHRDRTQHTADRSNLWSMPSVRSAVTPHALAAFRGPPAVRMSFAF